jgi:TATA-binding protein-associated factor
VCYAKVNPEDPDPVFTSLYEWEEAKSTKMDACAKICRHYLSRDDVADVDFKDGQLVLPAHNPSGQPFTQRRRVLIYSEFPSMAPILRNVSAPNQGLIRRLAGR